MSKSKDQTQAEAVKFEVHVFNDGYTIDGSALNPTSKPENQKFIDDLKNSIIPESLRKGHKKVDLVYFEHEMTFEDFSKAPAVEKTYQIDIWDDGFTINGGPFRPISIKKNKDFVDDLKHEKVPEELIRPGILAKVKQTYHPKNHPKVRSSLPPLNLRNRQHRDSSSQLGIHPKKRIPLWKQNEGYGRSQINDTPSWEPVGIPPWRA
uniref:SEP domain-containing protein n=1 Tax=Coptotermes formosanus TaxID=36987 RepID=R4UVG6_COPFO|nr:hypothetical protein [Coptotermes formosanus]